MRLYRIEAELPPSDIPGINADLSLNRELIAPLLVDGQRPPALPYSTLCCLLLAVQPYRPFTLEAPGHPYDEEAWAVLREVGAAYEADLENIHRLRGTMGCPYLLVEEEEGRLPFRMMSEMLPLLKQHEKRPRDGSGLARIAKYYNREKNRWEVGSPFIPEELIAGWRYSLMFTWPEYKAAIELLISAKSES